VNDDLLKIKVKGWGGKMKNREKWRLIVQEVKAHPEL
jgi:nitrogen fixation protein